LKVEMTVLKETKKSDEDMQMKEDCLGMDMPDMFIDAETPVKQYSHVVVENKERFRESSDRLRC